MGRKREWMLALYAAILVCAAQRARAAEDLSGIKGYLHNIKGYVQTMYGASSDKTPDSFSMRLARLVFSGKANDDWTYTFQLDALQQPALLDAYLDFSRSKVLKFRAGQFKVPFSMESLAGDSDLDTINRSQVVNALTPGRDTGTKGRDIGVSLQLTASPWNVKKFIELTAGQFNGEGANAADKNHRKGLALRGALNPSAAVSCGVSYYDGNRTSSGTVSHRFGVEGSLAWGRAYLKGEYIRGRDMTVREEGWYAQTGFFVLPKVLQAVAKYDVYDPDLKKFRNRTAVSTAGINWYFADSMRLQTNYEWKYKERSGIVCNTFSSVLSLTF